jgi:hypothetical protein
MTESNGDSLKLKISTLMHKNPTLLITITVGIISPIYPIYILLTSGDLLIPSAVCAIMLTISIILSLILYYERKIVEIKIAPSYKLTEQYIEGKYTPTEFKNRLAQLEKLGYTEKKSQEKSK